MSPKSACLGPVTRECCFQLLTEARVSVHEPLFSFVLWQSPGRSKRVLGLCQGSSAGGLNDAAPGCRAEPVGVSHCGERMCLQDQETLILYGNFKTLAGMFPGPPAPHEPLRFGAVPAFSRGSVCLCTRDGPVSRLPRACLCPNSVSSRAAHPPSAPRAHRTSGWQTMVCVPPKGPRHFGVLGPVLVFPSSTYEF